MPHLSTQGRRFAAAFALPILLLACLGLAACGSSSSSPSATAAAASSTASSTGTSSAGAPAPTSTAPAGGTGSTTAPTGPGAPPAGAPNGDRFAAVRECLSKSGVKLPQRPAGGGLLGGDRAAGGPTLPKSMTKAQYVELLKKCGGNLRAPGTFGNRRPLAGAGFRQALAKFGTCLRQNGVKLPPPNTSGKGPIFNTKGVDTTSPQFKQAEVKCRAVLLAGLRASKAGAAGSGAAGAGTSGAGAG